MRGVNREGCLQEEQPLCFLIVTLKTLHAAVQGRKITTMRKDISRTKSASSLHCTLCAARLGLMGNMIKTEEGAVSPE